MFDPKKEKLDFIRKHSQEIAPITKSPEILRAIDEVAGSEVIPGDKIDRTLEEFETKIFLLEKSESEPGQKRVLVETDNPGSYAAIKPLISALEKDSRCSGVTVLTSGVASLYFERDFRGHFSKIQERDRPVLADILDVVERKPVDVVLATLSAKNAPDSLALFGSKGNLGAQKLFLVLESWGQKLNKVLSENRENLEKIDGVFCNDELAKSLFCDKFPDFPAEKVYAFGTPIIDSIDIKHGDEYRKRGREKLGIDENAEVLTYLGCISSEAKEQYASRDDVDEKTFRDTIQQVVQLAGETPDKSFVFAFRPHPRDDKKEEKYQFMKGVALPPNLSFKDGGASLSINEIIYGSDIVLSIFSTENFLAPLRGRKGIFLGFSGKGMGGDLLETSYGQSAVSILTNRSDAIRVSDSSENLKRDIKSLINADLPSKSAGSDTSVTKRILDLIISF